MFAVIFEVQPKPDRWDQYLGPREAVAPGTGADRRLHRQRALQEPAHRGPLAVAVDLGRREIGDPLADPCNAPRRPGEGPLRGVRGLSSAGRRDHRRHAASRPAGRSGTAAVRCDRGRRGEGVHSRSICAGATSRRDAAQTARAGSGRDGVHDAELFESIYYAGKAACSWCPGAMRPPRMRGNRPRCRCRPHPAPARARDPRLRNGGPARGAAILPRRGAPRRRRG